MYFTTLGSEDIERAAINHDLRLFRIEGSNIESGAELISQFGKALQVSDLGPQEDWDYLDECLVDMEGYEDAKGFVFLYDKFGTMAERDPKKWRLALQVFRAAVDEGRKVGPPRYFFFRDPSRSPDQDDLEVLM